MPMLDVFNSSAFNTAELTAAINLVPNQYGRLAEMRLFQPKPITTTSAFLELKDGVLNLLPSKARGAPGTLGTVGKRRLVPVNVPHIPHDDVVHADDVQNVRAFGSENRLMAVADLVNDKLITMRAKHDQTLEYLRWGALAGVVLDADGTTELLDLHDVLGTTEHEEDFVFGTATTDIRAAVVAAKRWIDRNLNGLSYQRIHCFCSEEFFSALIAHPSVKTAFERWRDGEALRSDPRSGFEFAGVVFEEHVGQATDNEANVRRFIEEETARFVPIGAPDLLKEFYAPADFIEAVNTPGKPVYAKQERMKFDRGIELHTQSNPLPVVTRPELLVKATMS